MAGRQLSDRNEGSATFQPTGTRIPERLIAAGTAAVALLCYYATLLPGLDLGDSASFQTVAGSLWLTPRPAYPLYYALTNVFVWLHPGEPARAVNLASAVYGAAAVGVATLLTIRLVESRMAGVAAGLFLAFSYTFWSQAITAEVYTLHLLVVGASALALLFWAEHPTTVRLAVFYALYAVGFGNHLSMVLWLPAFAVFLLIKRKGGDADPLRPRTLLLAIAIAAAGALQYAWNFRGMWGEVEPPASFSEALGKFWFDVTKSDWRETIVMTVSEAGLESRPAMHWFDLQQQFGVPGIALAVIGALYILLRWPARGILLVLAYAANLIFAWTYNVGDVYIFFLPSHYVLALCAGGGAAALMHVVSRFSRTPRMSQHALAAAAGAACVLYPVWRGYDTFPAVDRSWDNRAVELLDGFTTPPRPAHLPRDPQQAAVYGADTNWQVQNAVEYYMREFKPATPWFVTEHLEWLTEGDVTRSFSAFIEANSEIGRLTLVAPGVYNKLRSLGYTGRLTEVRAFGDGAVDGRPPDGFQLQVSSVRPGTPYALAILLPDREYPLDRAAVAGYWQALTGGSAPLPPLRPYTIVLGRTGEAPTFVKGEDRPYRARVQVGSFDFDVRMESWLPTDTIRRAGFGHVIVDRTHLLTMERGISFAALGRGARPAYAAGLFAPIPRYVPAGR